VKGYSADKVFSWQHQSLRDKAQHFVEFIKEPEPGMYRCHEVTRFVFQLLAPWAFHVLAPEAKLVDGNFAGVDHTWIRLDESVILDVYSVARLPPVQLVHVGSATLLRRLYIGEGEKLPTLEGDTKIRLEPPRDDVRTDVVERLMSAVESMMTAASTSIEELRAFAARNIHGVPAGTIGAMAIGWED